MARSKCRFGNATARLLDVLDLSRFVSSPRNAWLFAKGGDGGARPGVRDLCVWLGLQRALGSRLGGSADYAARVRSRKRLSRCLASKLVFQERATAREAIFATFGVFPRVVLARFFQTLLIDFGRGHALRSAPIFFSCGPVLLLFLPEVVILEGVDFSNAACARVAAFAMTHSGDAFRGVVSAHPAPPIGVSEWCSAISSAAPLVRKSLGNFAAGKRSSRERRKLSGDAGLLDFRSLLRGLRGFSFT